MQKFTKKVKAWEDYGSCLLTDNNLNEVIKILKSVKDKHPNETLEFDIEWDYGNVEVTYLYYEVELEGDELEEAIKKDKDKKLKRLDSLEKEIKYLKRRR